jgi:hypothetical protein
MIVDGAFTLKVETEEDILLVAELLRRRGLTSSKRLKVTTERERRPSGKIPQGRGPIESHRKMLDLIKSNHPSGEFHVSDAVKLIKKQMKLGRTSTGNALKTGVKIGELFRVNHGVYTFEKSGISSPLPVRPNSDFLLDLIADRPDGLLEICRIAKTLSNELPLVIDNSGIYSRLTDGHGQIMLDMTLDKSLFSGYHVKKPVEFKIDAPALYTRLDRDEQLHLSLKQENSPLMVGNYELRVDSYRDFDGKVVPPANVSPKAELQIPRVQLERILTDNAVNCQHIDIIAEQDIIVFESHGEAGDYKSTIAEGHRCHEPSRSRLHYQETLLHCLKASKCEMVKLSIGEFLHVEFMSGPAIKISLFLATKKEEQVMQPAL